MRLLFAVILGMIFFSGRGLAQEDYIGNATTALQDVLSNLQQSVEKLSLDNSQLAARDNAMKQQVSQLQEQLESLEAQGDLLNKTASQADQNPHRAQQVDHLEKENADLDNHIQKVENDINLIQQSLGTQSPDFEAEARRQKEKLKLMKMIYDSQQRQETLHEAIQVFQKTNPSQPSDSALARQQSLKGQIKDLEDQLAAYQSENLSANAGTVNQWDDRQINQLQLELKDLEKNYLQLKDLTAQMSQKAKTSRITISQRMEEEKLQNSLDDLNRQGVGLRRDLDDLRTQMIDLDKRKSRLETMVQQLP